MKKDSAREDRFTWSAGQVKFTPPPKKDQKKEEEQKKTE